MYGNERLSNVMLVESVFLTRTLIETFFSFIVNSLQLESVQG